MNNPRILVVLIALVVAATAACDGCGDDAPAEVDERVEQMASFIPGEADAALMAPELSDFPENFDYALQRADHVWAETRQVENTLNQALGFPTAATESWEAAGFDTDGSLMVSLVGARPVMTAHIADKNAFETHVIGHMREKFEAETPIEDQVFGDREFRVSGGGMPQDMAWFYDDSLVVLVMPPYSAFDYLDGGSATSVAADIGEMGDEDSLAHDDAFNEFLDAVGQDYPVSLFFDARRYFDRPEVDNEIGIPQIDDVARSLVEWSRHNADTTGIGFRAGDQSVKLHGFASTDEETLEEARRAYTTTAETDTTGMLTENTAGAVKTAFDLSRAVDGYLEDLPEQQRDNLEGRLDQWGTNYEIDMREDVIEAISGHSLLVFYGIGPEFEQVLGHVMSPRPDIQSAARVGLNNSGLMLNFHFEQQDQKDRLVGRMSDFAGELIDRDQLTYDGAAVDGFEVLQAADVDRVPIRMFSHNQSLTLASTGLSPDSAYEYITDRREEGGLAEAEGFELGARFAEADDINGLYLNFENLQNNLRQLGTAGSAAANYLDSLDELLMTATVADDGFRSDTELTFTEPLDDEPEQ